jgi:hypothetical protein
MIVHHTGEQGVLGSGGQGRRKFIEFIEFLEEGKNFGIHAKGIFLLATAHL